MTSEEAVPGVSPVQDLTTGEPSEQAPRLHIVAQPRYGSIVVRHPRPTRRPRLRRRRVATS